MAKRIIALLLAAGITVTLAACGGDSTVDTSSVVDTSVVESVVSEDANKPTESQEAASKEESKVESVESKVESKVESVVSSKENQTGSSQPAQTTPSKPQAGQPSRVVGTGDNNKKPAGNSGNATNQSSSTNIQAAIDLSGLKIKKGKSVIDGLDFGGKTFTMAITEEGQYHTQSFNRTVAAFEKQFNCKIKFETFTFADYNKQVAQKLSAGKAPDICFVHGFNFPACAIDGMYNDLSKTISQGDIMDSNNPTAGGLDMNKTSYFVYNNKIYGTCNFNSCFPYVIYYNKKQMADAGFSGNKDPRVLAERTNNWTWEFIRNLGRKLTTADVYFLSNSFTGRGLPLSFGGNVTTVSKGVYKENVTSVQYMEAMKFMQSLTHGNGAITEPRDSAHGYNSYETLLKGGVYLWTEETSKYLDISKEVKGSTAFGRDLKNLEITTMPLGSTNTKKAYPTGWLTAIASGKGTDPRVAVAWDVFRSGYQDPVKGDNEMDDEDQAFVDGLLKGDICCEVGCFGTSDMTSISLTESGIVQKIAKGDDVTKCINEVKDQITTCIKQTMKK